jgi:flagellar hook-associated protein 2
MATSSVNLGSIVSGGIDVATTVASLMQLYDKPETLWATQQTKIQNQVSALSTIGSDMSNLLLSAQSLNDFTGGLNAKNSNSSDSSLVTATAGATAAVGNHTVTVSNLAATGSYYSAELATSTTPFAGGDFTFKVQGAASSITIPAGSYGNTIQGLATAITNYVGTTGVTASVINDSLGSRLALVSNNSGAAGDLNVTASPTGLGFTKATTGIDAKLNVDGVPIQSGSNTVTSAIPGVTLNLFGATDPPTSVSVGITADTTQASTAIQSFVTAYNTVVTDLNAQETTGSGSTAVLTGDSTVRDLQQRILTDISSSVTGNGGLVNLESIGVQLQNDGTLSVNSTTLNNALATNFNAVQNLFQNPTGGVASTFNSDLENMTDPTQGEIALAVKGDNSNIVSLGQSIANFSVQAADQQTMLTTQWNQINVTLEELPILQQQTTSQLANIA